MNCKHQRKHLAAHKSPTHTHTHTHSHSHKTNTVSYVRFFWLMNTICVRLAMCLSECVFECVDGNNIGSGCVHTEENSIKPRALMAKSDTDNANREDIKRRWGPDLSSILLHRLSPQRSSQTGPQTTTPTTPGGSRRNSTTTTLTSSRICRLTWEVSSGVRLLVWNHQLNYQDCVELQYYMKL